MLWALLFAMAFKVGNVGAWSVGVAYVLYDTVLLLFVAWMTLPILRPRPSPSPAAAVRRNTLGVIVASHNEAAVLPVTLSALLGQTDAPDRIVIADDGSTDGTAELLTTHYGLVAPELGSLSAASAAHPLFTGCACRRRQGSGTERGRPVHRHRHRAHGRWRHAARQPCHRRRPPSLLRRAEPRRRYRRHHPGVQPLAGRPLLPVVPDL